jgi:hypothetical protein
MPAGYDYITIEPACGATYPAPGEPETFAIYGYSVYENSSVLAGQEKRSCLGSGFKTVQDAIVGAREAGYPNAEVSESSGYIPATVPHTAPAWFDPLAAGERWDDDY